MLRKRDSKKSKQQSTNKFQPMYKKPEILLIDLPGENNTRVRSAGFNAQPGTFGSPYRVKLSDGYLPVIGKVSLPSYTEQEIVFIDLTPPDILDNPDGDKLKPDSENDWWAKCNKGKIDPRPRFMRMVCGDFDRILSHGGFFVVFAQPKLVQELVWASSIHDHLRVERKITSDNWSFLSILDDLKIYADNGREIVIPSRKDYIFDFLRIYYKDECFTATFDTHYRLSKVWRPLVFNKYGNCIGGLLEPKEYKGRVLILPQISNKSDIIVSLLQDILPHISPHLFPDFEGLRWIERDEYELKPILELKSKIIEVRQQTEKEIIEINKQINDERNKFGFLHGMLIKQNRELVKDIESCLKLLGFSDIIDVDEQIRKIDPTQPKQEDLQIEDRSPTLLFEIRGMSGLPREPDTIKVSKYVLRRMKEWNRTDVHGVSIINHQRNLPPLDRDNKNVFTQPQIDDAVNHDVTILTTWDLFLLIRGMLQWKWKPQAIQELFYKKGKMPRSPTIYKPTGTVVHYWDEISVVSVKVVDYILSKGVRIGYIIPTGFLEEDIKSLQIDKKDVDKATPGQTVGIKTLYSKKDLPKGTIVCKITADT